MGCVLSKPEDSAGSSNKQQQTASHRSSRHSLAATPVPGSAPAPTRPTGVDRSHEQRGASKAASPEASDAKLDLCIRNDSAATGEQCNGDRTGVTLAQFPPLDDAPSSSSQQPLPLARQRAGNASSTPPAAATSGTAVDESGHNGNGKQSSSSARFIGIAGALSPRSESSCNPRRRAQVSFSGVAEFSLDSSVSVSTTSLHRHRVLHVPPSAGGSVNGTSATAPSGSPMVQFQPPSFRLGKVDGDDGSPKQQGRVAAAGVLGPLRSLTTDCVREMVLTDTSGSAAEGVDGRQQSGSVVVPMFDPTDRESIQLHKQISMTTMGTLSIGDSDPEEEEEEGDTPTPVLHRDQLAHSRKHKRNGAGRRGSCAATPTHDKSRRQSVFLPPRAPAELPTDADIPAQSNKAIAASSAPTLRAGPPQPLSRFPLALPSTQRDTTPVSQRLQAAASWSRPASHHRAPSYTPPTSTNPLQLSPLSSLAPRPPQQRVHEQEQASCVAQGQERPGRQASLLLQAPTFLARPRPNSPHSGTAASLIAIRRRQLEQRQRQQQQQVSSVPSSAIVAARCMVTSQQQQQLTPTINRVRCEEDGFARLHHATEDVADGSDDEKASGPPTAGSRTPPPPPDHHHRHCGDSASHPLVMGDEMVA